MSENEITISGSDIINAKVTYMDTVSGMNSFRCLDVNGTLIAQSIYNPEMLSSKINVPDDCFTYSYEGRFAYGTKHRVKAGEYPLTYTLRGFNLLLAEEEYAKDERQIYYIHSISADLDTEVVEQSKPKGPEVGEASTRTISTRFLSETLTGSSWSSLRAAEGDGWVEPVFYR